MSPLPPIATIFMMIPSGSLPVSSQPVAGYDRAAHRFVTASEKLTENS
jgi:hypothetical protein